MADDTPPRQMSLIPYGVNQEVVLRRGNAVVVYDPDSQQLSVRRAADDAVELTRCPTCNRPWREDFEDRAPDHSRPNSHDKHFVDPEYFAMLAASQHPSPAGSGPPTPIRRLRVPALRSGRSRNVSGTNEPPTGAEFISSEPNTTAEHHGINRKAFSPGYYQQFFREKRELGRGGNGVVLLVEHLMDDVSLGEFACKRIPVGDDHNWLEKVLVEVKLLQKIPHQNLVAYHWVWLEDHQPSRFGPSIPCLWILQELCNGGDLHSYVLGPQEAPSTTEKLKQKIRRRSKGDASPPTELRGPSKLTFDEIFSFFRDITSGLHHLHTKGYIHRDLKPSNCLLQREGQRTRVLISDFGEVQAAGTRRGNTGATGTISYCAPEVLRQETPTGTYGDFTTKSDIFSLGMIVYFMCFGRLPYSNADDINEESEDLEQLRAEITQWPGFDDETRARPDLPEKLYKYLKRLLSVDPNQRPSTEEILASIKGGAALGEILPGMEDGNRRISVADSPAPRPSSGGRKQSTYISRPGLSTLRRHTSDEHERALSPVKRDGPITWSQSRPASPIDSSVVVRPRKIDLPLETEMPSPQQSPRLMLPPPPERSLAQRLLRWVRHPNSLAGLRALLFLAKLLSLFTPCSPYAANAWLLYPLLVMAALDVGILAFDIRRSILLLGVHLVAIATAYQHGRLCEGKVIIWEEL